VSNLNRTEENINQSEKDTGEDFADIVANLGLVVRGKIRDFETIKRFAVETANCRILFQTVSLARLTVVSEKGGKYDD
jgi:hypothetical protein